MDQVPFLPASGRLTSRSDMDMDVSCAMLNGPILMLDALKSLVKVSGLSDINRNPLAALRLFGKNVIGWL